MDFYDQSIELIKMYEPFALQADPRGYCVCSSFGKDSMALIEVFKRAGVKFFVQYNITGIDPPELVYFAREQMKRLEEQDVHTFIAMYDKSIWQMIVEKKMPPTRNRRYCCAELKEKRLSQTVNCWHSFGVRKAESRNRSKRKELELITPNIKDKIMANVHEPQLFMFSDNDEKRRQIENCTTKGVRAINPLIYWSDEQLWDFTRSEKVPYCKLYDEGWSRLGCIGCPMAGKGRIKDFELYPKFKAQYIRTFDRMLIARNGNTKNPNPWKTGQEVFNKWMEIDQADDNQTSVFDFMED